MGHYFKGLPLQLCPAQALDVARASAVVVTGDGPNFCGHALLNTGGCAGWYFHVAETTKQPYFMGASGYARYIRESRKREIRRIDLHIQNPTKAREKLMELLSTNWYWGVIPHNCATFVEEVAHAGGSPFELRWNCPIPETRAGWR